VQANAADKSRRRHRQRLGPAQKALAYDAALDAPSSAASFDTSLAAVMDNAAGSPTGTAIRIIVNGLLMSSGVSKGSPIPSTTVGHVLYRHVNPQR
jgi:hypothetical protein